MARRDDWLNEVEIMLVDAWSYLMRLPDRERAWLASASRSAWPVVIRDPITDYAEQEEPRMPLGRREMAMVGKVFLDEGCLMVRLDVALRPLVAVVLSMKARPERGGFKWEPVWERMGGKACGVSTDGLRNRYERALVRLAVMVDEAVANQSQRAA